MEIIWEHKIFTVSTDRLVKYLEFTAYENHTIRLRYISKSIVEFIEKEETFNFNYENFHKSKELILNFPKLEILELDISQLFVFMKMLLQK